MGLDSFRQGQKLREQGADRGVVVLDQMTGEGCGIVSQRRGGFGQCGGDGHATRAPGPMAGTQWLVPSEKRILLKTLYFPTGLRIGSRVRSSSVAAS